MIIGIWRVGKKIIFQPSETALALLDDSYRIFPPRSQKANWAVEKHSNRGERYSIWTSLLLSSDMQKSFLVARAVATDASKEINEQILLLGRCERTRSSAQCLCSEKYSWLSSGFKCDATADKWKRSLSSFGDAEAEDPSSLSARGYNMMAALLRGTWPGPGR